ncbi:DUF6064 family protein [Lamprobacter modestohalophilus]|uniref:DUF6064 family protein n=1 Tax=Lamprobacter modestohalophilus TaxID=1064514 RepID=UPI002ADEDD60|nr:DUF6064 family protein [Lamprobacter modestohalophilus]MEA1048529.1 DUF6064 family protein [Lamprobacter modestohalophilus]
MADWSSYALSDFLPFSLETYQRLGLLYNARFSAAVVAGLGIGLFALLLLWRPTPLRLRLALAGLGLCWLWISWAYQLQTLAPLLWAGELFAIAFALQSGLLLASAVYSTPRLTPHWVVRGLAAQSPAGQPRLGVWLGAGMLVFAVLLLPLIELAAGQPWPGLSFFGSAATPTAIGTLGLAAMLGPRLWLLLTPVPVLWCLVVSLLLLGLDDPLWALPALAVPVSLVAALLGRRTWEGPGR